MQLLDEYEARRAAFQSSKVHQRVVWDELAKALSQYDFTGEDCSKKFRNLKANYNKIKTAVGSKQSSGKSVVIRWPYFRRLETLTGESPQQYTLETISSSSFAQSPLSGDPAPSDNEHTVYEEVYVTEEAYPSEQCWNEEATLLLIKEYSDRKYLFRNRKYKNKPLWNEVSRTLGQHNHKFTPDDCNRKFRNLKIHYKKIKFDRGSKGRLKRTKWPYYPMLEEVFADDASLSQPEPRSPELEESEVDLDEWEEVSAFGDGSLTEESFWSRRLEMEEQRLQEVKKLRKAIERSNQIQEERNKLLEQLLKKN